MGNYKINEINAPCKGCEERHSLCHAECLKYMEYKRALADKKGRHAERNKIDDTLKQLRRHRAETRKGSIGV